MKDLKPRIEQFYENQGILNSPLIFDCPQSNSCWSSIEESSKENCDWKIYSPFIGEAYSKGRILTLGINMYTYGDPEAQDKLAKTAIEQIMRGQKRTFANSNYRGTLLWHRLLSYSALILREVGIINLPANRPYPSKDELKSSLDFIAATNSIKCSPNTKNSKPSVEMWENCPKFILKEEINILKPKYLIVLGIENYRKLRSIYTFHDETVDGEVRFCKFKNGDDKFDVFGIPHPSSSNGTSIKRMDELERILIEQYKNKN